MTQYKRSALLGGAILLLLFSQLACRQEGNRRNGMNPTNTASVPVLMDTDTPEVQPTDAPVEVIPTATEESLPTATPAPIFSPTPELAVPTEISGDLDDLDALLDELDQILGETNTEIEIP